MPITERAKEFFCKEAGKCRFYGCFKGWMYKNDGRNR